MLSEGAGPEQSLQWPWLQHKETCREAGMSQPAPRTETGKWRADLTHGLGTQGRYFILFSFSARVGIKSSRDGVSCSDSDVY